MVICPWTEKSSQKSAGLCQPLWLSENGYYHSLSLSIQLWRSPTLHVQNPGDRRHSQHGRPAAKGSQLEYTRPRRACNDKLNIGRLDETTSPDEHASSHGVAGPGSSFGPWFILIASQLGVSSHRSCDVAVNSKGRRINIEPLCAWTRSS